MPLCECGCGSIATKKYLQGHNAKRGIGGSLKNRILSKVNKLPSGCWEWTGNLHWDGYGEIRLKNGKSGGKRAQAHRVSYETFKGIIPKEMLVCHVCDNKKCVNPDHLFIGSHKDNSQDMVLKNRNRKGENNKSAKITEVAAIEIKNSKAKTGMLSKQYGVSSVQIRNIRNGKHWKHLNH